MALRETVRIRNELRDRRRFHDVLETIISLRRLEVPDSEKWWIAYAMAVGALTENVEAT